MRRRALIFVLPLLAGALLACADDAPPRVLRAQLLSNTNDIAGPYRFEVVAVDDRRIKRVDIIYEIRTSTAPRPVVPQVTSANPTFTTTTSEDGSVYRGEIPGLPLGTLVAWAAQAEDHRGQVTFFPSNDEPAFTFTVGNFPSQPELYGVVPEFGPTTGGTEVLLVGRDFREGFSVSFGSGAAEPLEFISRFQVRVLTPPGPEGPVNVRLLNPDGGEVSLDNGFVYLPVPTIEAIMPNEGPEAGGTDVTITGRNFGPGTTFSFGDSLCLNVVVASDRLARCTTAAHPAGLVDVRVERPERGFSVFVDGFTYIAAPIVLAIDPAQGPDLGGTAVTITGQNFVAGATIDFDRRPAGQIQFVSSTELRAVTPPHPEGPSDVRVTNPDVQDGVLPDGFLFVGPPELFSVEPPHAAVEGGAELTVRGNNLLADSLLAVPGFGSLTCVFVSINELRCTVPPGRAGNAGLSVLNPDGRSDALANAFTYFDLVEVTPDFGPSSGGTSVLVRGRFVPPSSSIFFDGVEAACMFWRDAFDCVTPPGAPSFVDVSALPPEPGQVPTVLVNGYEYIPPPVITAITPDEGPLRGGTDIVISGTGFQSGATVTVGGAVCTNVVVIDANTITCSTPPGAAGVAEVVVNNPDGQSGSFVGFEYIPITFEPAWGLIDGQTNLIIRGIDLPFPPCVRLGNTTCIPAVTIVSDRELRVVSPARTDSGAVSVSVESVGEIETSPDTFSYRRYVDQTPNDTAIAGQGETADVVIADFDNDGDGDLVYIGGGGNMASPSFFVEQQAAGWRALPLGTGVSAIGNEADTCDVDGDGDLDLTYGVSGGGVQLFRNTGGGRFTPLRITGTPSDSYEASFHDVTGDGQCDFINTATQEANLVARNIGNANFTPIRGAIPQEPGFVHDHKMDSGDFDGDGDLDLIIVVDDVNFGTPPAQRHRIYLNNGSGSFMEDQRNRNLMLTLPGDIFDVRAGDLDGDGDIDILMPNIDRPPYMLINDGTGRFVRDQTRFDNQAGGYASMWMGDLEGDGDLDFSLVSFSDQGTALYLNDGTGNFIRARRGEPQRVPPSYRGTAGALILDEPPEFVYGVVFGDNRVFTPVE